MLAAYLYESIVCVSSVGSTIRNAARTACAAAVWPTPTAADRKRTRRGLTRRRSLWGVLIAGRFFGENEKIVEDFLRERIVREQFSVDIGHDELVRRFAVCDRECILLVVFDDTDDLEFIFLSVGRLDDQDVLQFDLAFADALARRAVVYVDIGPLSSRETPALVQIARDVCVVFR